jgi:autotransporter-associated beta strand protein
MKPKFKQLRSLAAFATISFTSQAHAQSFLNANDGGTWGTASNWDPASVPNAIDAAAVINGAGPSNIAPATSALDVVLDANYTIGSLTRSTSASVAATLLTGSGASSFDPTKGLTFASSDPAIIPQINTVGDTFFYAALFGTQGFEKTGSGRFTFRFNPINHTYTGLVKISAGTIGIQQDGSLGNTDNDIEIADAAKLWAEPGANAGTITLAESRTIHLNGAFPRIGSSNAAINFVIPGTVTDNGNGFGLEKTDPGVVTLSGSNSWTGGTRITQGTLRPTTPAALPGYAQDSIEVASTLSIPLGGEGEWSFEDVEALGSNSNLTFGNTGVVQLDITNSAEPVSLSGELAFAGLGKLGSSPLIITDQQSSLARLNIASGSVQVAETGGITSDLALTLSGNGASLELGATDLLLKSLSVSQIGITSIQNAGNINYTGTTSLTLKGNNNAEFDMSDSTSFSYGSSSDLLEIKFETNNDAPNCVNTTRLSGGTNTLTTTNTGNSRIIVGGGNNVGSGVNIHTLRLGAENLFKTPLLQIGNYNTGGVINFQDGLNDPSLTLRDVTGTGPLPKLIVGSTNSGARVSAGTFDLSAGSLDALVGSIMIGEHFANANNGSTSTMIMSAGSLTANTIVLAEKRGTGNPVLGGTLTQEGGTVTASSVIMGQTLPQGTNIPIAAQQLRPIYNLQGGTLSTAEIKEGIATVPITGTATIRNFNWSGGTLDAPNDSNITLSGALLLNLPISEITRTITADADQKISLADPLTKLQVSLNSTTRQTGSFTATADLELGASLVITDASPTALNPGEKLVLINYSGHSLTGTFNDLPDGADLVIGENTFKIQYADTLGGTGSFVTLSIPANDAPENFTSWATNNNVSGGATGDSDLDGISNLVEYALNLNPAASDGSAGNLTGNIVRFTKRAEAVTNGDISYSIETSTDLGITAAWETVTPTTNTDQEISYTLPSGPAKNFARLKVVQVP